MGAWLHLLTLEICLSITSSRSRPGPKGEEHTSRVCSLANLTAAASALAQSRIASAFRIGAPPARRR